jgi:hypothetical protein
MAAPIPSNATMFRTGTAIDDDQWRGLTQDNVWDMLVNVSPSDGTIQNNVITGLQFDNQGNFLGTG